ncbi:hypothetical protein [Exiguobacterium sp. s192]|uniref:hypothetical protein n=1 Tax=Exiguobacterium sp. s192 TaxID=2751206 RepID=UPI001BEA276C|nr:hypothetical protein [Exiguobacterium sp. s192]
MNRVTCPYCGSTLMKTEGIFFCSFCQMKVSKHITQTEGKRLVIRKREFTQITQLEQSTRLLKKLSTYELLELYHYIRTEEQAAEVLVTLAADLNDDEQISYDSVLETTTLTWKRKKRYILENLLRERFGYIPTVTVRFLEEYLEKVRHDEQASQMEIER